LPYILFQAAMC